MSDDITRASDILSEVVKKTDCDMKLSKMYDVRYESYDKTRKAMRQFTEYGNKKGGDYRGDSQAQYYQGMASGLRMALQFIDAERYGNTCPDCILALIDDPQDLHSEHCIAGSGPTCSVCFACKCGKSDCDSSCKCKPE